VIGCSFCDEITVPADNLFYNIIGKKYNVNSRIIYQNENWVVLPTLGCFTIGYILIVSRKHFLSIGTIPNNLYDDFITIICKCGSAIKKQFGSSYVAFEHGSLSSEYRLSCCIDHLHLHLIPCNNDYLEDICKEYKINFEELNSYNEVGPFVKRNIVKSYMLFQNIDKRIYIINTTNNIFPSQFFRQIFSKKLGDNLIWDWRHNYYEDNIFKTIQLSTKNKWFE
jgi:diadenosine tetraphosphate (Ap4A) HIT family hydrolase